jgi:hypothetical protein
MVATVDRDPEVKHLPDGQAVANFSTANPPGRKMTERVSRLLTSGDGKAVQALVWAAYSKREVLDLRWWRLLYFAVFWSGLSTLRPPGYRADESEQLRWQRWCRWLRTRSLVAGKMTVAAINPLPIGAMSHVQLNLPCSRSEVHARSTFADGPAESHPNTPNLNCVFFRTVHGTPG